MDVRKIIGVTLVTWPAVFVLAVVVTLMVLLLKENCQIGLAVCITIAMVISFFSGLYIVTH